MEVIVQLWRRVAPPFVWVSRDIVQLKTKEKTTKHDTTCLGQICFNSFTVLWYSVLDRYVSIILQYCDTVSWSYMFQFIYSIVIHCRDQICFNSFTVLWYSVVDIYMYVTILLQYCDIMSWTDMFQLFYSIVIQCHGQICFNSFTVLWYNVVDRYVSIILQYCDSVLDRYV